jgi:hypothetical protein
MNMVSMGKLGWRGVGCLALLALLWGLASCARQAPSMAEPPVAQVGAPATEAQRCVDGGGTWDTGNTRIPPYCAKGTAAQCTAQGGTWQRVCMMGTLACVVPYSDAGKPCTDGSACAGKRCLAPQGTASFPGQGPKQGQCIANNNPCYFGINIEKGFTVPTAVAD